VARDLAAVLDPTAQRKDGYLEGQHVWTWALGHLGELAGPEEYDPALKGRWSLDRLPVVPTDWRVVPREGKDGAARRQLAVVTRLLRQASEVVVATDAGREGELIWEYIRTLSGYTGPERRLWLSETTPAAVRRAWAALEAPHLALREAAKTRARADWLVGMNATMALSARHGGLWSAGRVQTPTLAMIVRREREVRDFKPRRR
jgi:DNA topoisomerase-3